MQTNNIFAQADQDDQSNIKFQSPSQSQEIQHTQETSAESPDIHKSNIQPKKPNLQLDLNASVVDSVKGIENNNPMHKDIDDDLSQSDMQLRSSTILNKNLNQSTDVPVVKAGFPTSRGGFRFQN